MIAAKADALIFQKVEPVYQGADREQKLRQARQRARRCRRGPP